MATPLKRLLIDLRKLNEAHQFEGKPDRNGHVPLYAALTLWDSGKIGQYGDDGFLTQDVGKEARERGEKGGIVGNSKPVQAKSKPAAPTPPPATRTQRQGEPDEEVPF